mgnify:FL=1
MTLMENSKCYFCKGKFVVACPSDDFKRKKKKQIAETH